MHAKQGQNGPWRPLDWQHGINTQLWWNMDIQGIGHAFTRSRAVQIDVNGLSCI